MMEMGKFKTLKEIVKLLKKNYKYVRLIELHNTMKLEKPETEFNQFVLASKKYSTFEEEIDNINIKLSHVELRVIEILESSKRKIPIFEIMNKMVDYGKREDKCPKCNSDLIDGNDFHTGEDYIRCSNPKCNYFFSWGK